MTITSEYRGMKFSRDWAMPSAETFSIPPIAALLSRYVEPSMVVIDPFARDSTVGTITNDLNPETRAQYHEDAIRFLNRMLNARVNADVVLFDPPYSPRQVNELYKTANIEKSVWSNSAGINEIKSALRRLLRWGGVAISCGWSSGGLGCDLVLEELLLVPHGGMHADTIVTVERKVQANLL